MKVFKNRLALLSFFVLAIIGLLILDSAQIQAVGSDGTVVDYQKISNTAGGFTGVLDDADFFGSGLVEVGDIDGDGVLDLAVGAHRDDDGGTNRGAVYILFMNTDGTVREHQKISQLEGGFDGTLINWGDFGLFVGALGDWDGDGVPDIAVSERGRNDGGTLRGGFHIIFLNDDGTVKGHQLISQTSGGFEGELPNGSLFGTCIKRIDDVNNDGVDDLAVCASEAPGDGTQRGALWVLYMTEEGTVQGQHKIDDVTGGFEVELDDVDKFASSMTVVADLDGDGIKDWIVGTPLDDDGGSNRGALYILFMNANGTVKDYAKISSQTTNFADALSDEDRFGSTVEPLGDLDGDGVPDIAVGAWQDDDGGSNRGAVYILFLTLDGGVKRYQKISDTEGGFEGELDDDDYFGFQLAVLNDLNNDGLVELAVGAFNDDDGGSNRGAVWILHFNALEDPETIIRPRDGIFVTSADFIINNGAGCTTDRTVTLEFIGNNVADVVVGTDTEFIGATWEPINLEKRSIEFMLPEGDGEKQVYVRYRSCTANQSATFRQTIVLDTENDCSDVEGAQEPAIPVDEDSDKPIAQSPLPAFAPSPVTGEMESVDEVRIGDVIKGRSYTTVYAINEKGRRMPFLNEEIYFTWYPSFDQVKVVSDATLSVIPLCHPVDVRPETTLVKFADSNKVYYPEKNEQGMSTWRWITSESLALNIIGTNWNRYIIDLPEALRQHVTFGDNIDKKSDVMVDKSKLLKIFE